MTLTLQQVKLQEIRTGVKAYVKLIEREIVKKTILLEVICLFSDCEISYLSPERRIENILTEVFNFIHCSSQVKLTAINEQFNTLPRK